MTELLLKAHKYMNVEDALAAIGVGDTRKDRRNVQEYSKGKKEGKKRLFIQPLQRQVKDATHMVKLQIQSTVSQSPEESLDMEPILINKKDLVPNILGQL